MVSANPFHTKFKISDNLDAFRALTHKAAFTIALDDLYRCIFCLTLHLVYIKQSITLGYSCQNFSIYQGGYLLLI